MNLLGNGLIWSINQFQLPPVHSIEQINATRFVENLKIMNNFHGKSEPEFISDGGENSTDNSMREANEEQAIEADKCDTPRPTSAAMLGKFTIGLIRLDARR